MRGRIPGLRVAPSGLPVYQKIPWQSRRDSLDSGFRACWPLLARLCSHSKSPIRQETIPFEDIRMDCSKDVKPVALEECSRGHRLLKPAASILSKTAGARGETCNLFNGLIAWPAQTGEDRILLSAAASGGRGVGSNLDAPRLQGCGRAGFPECVLPGLSERPACLEVRFRAGRWVQPGGPACQQWPPKE